MVYWSFHGGSSTMTIYHHNSERSTYHLPYWIPILSPNWSGNPVCIFIYIYTLYIHSGLTLRILLPRSRDLSNLRWSVESLCNSRYHGITEKVVSCHSVGSLVLLWLLDHPDLQVINSATSRRWFVRLRKSWSRYKQRLCRPWVPLGQRNTELHFSRSHGPIPGSDRQC